MSFTLSGFLQFDLPAVLVSMLAAVCCGMLGNFLVLRRQSLVGDTISHVVLPGIVIGFLITGTMATLAMMTGATVAAIVAVAGIELIRRLGRLEPGAAMGVVFTTMFALGVVLLEQSGAANIHLDVEHTLYGNVEGTIWFGAENWSAFMDQEQLAQIPPSITRVAVVTAVVTLTIVAFFKELKVTTFDPDLADSLGISSRWVGFGLIVLVAVAAVAAFDAVGSILVIAMFICPAATARLLTDRLSTQIGLSVLVAIASSIGGYVLAAYGPFWFGGTNSLNAAGMIAVTAGVLQTVAMLFAPRYGVLSRSLRRLAPP